MEYKTGYDFFSDLVLQFGKDAVKVANQYLDIPLNRSDTEEFTFRCELYKATKAFMAR